MKLISVLPMLFLGLCLTFWSNSAAAALAPTFTSAPTTSGLLLVGKTITFCAAATDPQSLPITTTYDYGDGSSDTLGIHIYTAVGVYPVTVTISNGLASNTATFSLVITEVANLWIKKQSIKASASGKQSWQAQYIYNADRTLVNIFNPATDSFLASLGTIPSIQIPNAGAQKFSGSKPKFTFKSAKGVIPSISVTLDESGQTITINATSETFADKVPGMFHNAVQMGATGFFLDQTLDSSGKFTANSGYRSAAFVVSAATVKVGKAGKDSALFSLFLGDPDFAFPSASAAKTVRVRVSNVVDQVVLEKDLTKSIASKAGKLQSGKDTTIPSGKFSYDSNKGKMTFGLSKATLIGLLTTSEEHVKVDVMLGDQTYTTHVTLFAAKAGAYGTKMPKKFTNFIPGKIASATAPTVISTIPANSATGVAINGKLSATFSQMMDSWTINTATFTLMQGTTVISGIATYAANSATAVFAPSSNLTLNTVYTATITTGATDLSGNALVCNYVWTFTTDTVADTTPPNVISTNPADNATDVAVNQTVNATFDKAMDPATINMDNFTLAGPGSGAKPITGMISYDVANGIATFTPESALAPSTLFTATVTTGVMDLAGNALAVNKVWTFTTGAQQALVPVPLGAAAPYGTFGGGSGMTNQGIFTVVNGDIGTTGASTTVTGFDDSVGDIYTETPLNKGHVNGRIYTAPPTPGGAGVGGNAATFAIATQAASDANAAYIKLSPASMPGGSDPGAGQLGGLTLPSGIYQSASGSFLITGSDLTLDAQGNANAVWVFQMASSLTVGGPGAPRSVILTNGARAKNVFWQVGSAATINAAGGGTMVGTIIASSGVTFSTAGNVTLTTLNGRALGLNASTTLVNTVINVPAP
ncbi:MAG TPA: ice-binding family protein [Planctomycetota bacterium]|nr:ice-binding family protein [Planctomycetota bacterium]